MSHHEGGWTKGDFVMWVGIAALAYYAAVILWRRFQNWRNGR